MNLVSLAAQFLTPDVISRIASFAGLDQSTVQRAAGAAIPALFAGLVNTTSKPGGSQRLFEAVTQHPAGDISAFRGAGEPAQRSVAANGMDLLSSLLGGSTFDKLKSAISSFAGTGEAASGTLLGSLAPVILGALGQEQRRAGLDAGGLHDLLMSQKDNIASAMPSGFSRLISGTGLMDSLTRGAEQVGQHARRGAETVSRSAPRTDTARHAGSTSMNWAYWAVPLLALAGLAWYMSTGPQEPQTVDATPPATEGASSTAGRAATTEPATPALPDIASLTAGSVPVGQNITAVLDNLKSTLSGVTDAQSAQAALPQLQDAAAKLDQTQTAVGQLAPEGKSTLAQYLRTAMPAVNEQFDKVLALPGVGEILRPTADAIRQKMDQFARA